MISPIYAQEVLRGQRRTGPDSDALADEVIDNVEYKSRAFCFEGTREAIGEVIEAGLWASPGRFAQAVRAALSDAIYFANQHGEHMHDEGHEEGYTEGHEEGYTEGHKEGYTEGHKEGYTEGHDDGYNEGHEADYTKGHEEGYTEGHEEGHEEGYTEGHEEGYTEGHEVARDEAHECPVCAIGRISMDTMACNRCARTFTLTQAGE